MKYWVYINDKVDGPYDGDNLVTLDGFTPDTLICSEADASSGKQTWVKASTIFEFEPTEEASQSTSAAQAAVNGLATSALLEKLNALTQELSNLQNKLDSMESNMESHIHKALEEQRTQLESAFAARTASLSNTSQEQAPAPVQESAANIAEEYPSQTEQAQPMAEETLVADSDSDAATKSTPEEELVIRSALDSLYSAQSEEQEEKDENEDTFQDLLTPTQAKELAKTTEQSTEAEPAAESQSEENQQAPADLLDELSGPAQDDVLDQIIKEKQEEEKGGISPLATAAIGAAAGAGIAALSTPEDKNESPVEKAKIDLSNFEGDMPEPLQIAPDKENPDQLEEVLPAEQMPADIAHLEESAGEKGLSSPQESLPGVEEAIHEKENLQLESKVDDNENTLRELVPGAKMEPPDGVLVTEQDLREAFTERIPNMQEELVVPFSEAELSSAEKKASLDFSNQSVSTDVNNPQNANDLTEIELKEGATYLISDFVPPAQANQDKKENPENTTTAVEDKTAEIQDMLSSASAEEEQKNNVEAMDIASALQQTSTKRGASFDIKTVPMVPEPGQAERLHVEGLDDVNAQHDIKPADVKSSKSAKMIIGLLVGFLLLIILYALLAFMHAIPDSINFLSKPAEAKAPAPVAQMEEMLPSASATAAENNSLENVLEEVKNYTLPNGYTLQSFIEEKHPGVSPDLITWDVSAAVEPDNYSVLAKVPPENPQSFKMSYRFNYNAVTKTLDPTISDAKNLLDSANSNSSSLPAGL